MTEKRTRETITKPHRTWGDLKNLINEITEIIAGLHKSKISSHFRKTFNEMKERVGAQVANQELPESIPIPEKAFSSLEVLKTLAIEAKAKEEG